MPFPEFSSETIEAALFSASAFGIVVVIGIIVRRVVLGRLEAWSKRTKSTIDDVVAAAIRTPSIIWILMLALYVAVQFLPLGLHKLEIIEKVLLAAGLFSLTLALSSLATQLIDRHAAKLDTSGGSTSLMRNIARIIVWVTGVLVILSSLGISIGPMLATLGVGGLAVALALQDTLANLFAGVHISLNKIVRIGDYVKLESGEEGYVTDINWRTTTIRMLANNMIIVPNSKLTQSIITNYYYPAKEMAVLVQVGVHYGSDLAHVERVTCEVGREVMKQVQGGVRDFEPFIRYHTFADSSINFTVILRGMEYVDQHLLKHEFIKRLQKRYAEEGICIPFPIRAINMSQENAQLK